MRRFKVAVVGATGLVGEMLINQLETRKFPVETLYPLASARSAGQCVEFQGEEIEILDLETFDFSGVDLALFSAGGEVSKRFAPLAAKSGCVVIDNSSVFRLEEDVPLVIPEVNAHAIASFSKRNIIANPNCSTIQMLVALKPLYDQVRIKRINVATYQSVSGTGRRALKELIHQLSDLLNGRPIEPSVYPAQIAFNVLPHIDVFQENGYTKEEMKMVLETQKIMEDTDILVNPTTTRVPVLYGHSEAIHVEFEYAVSSGEAIEWLSHAPGVQVVDDQKNVRYPTTFTHAVGSDDVFVGRIREDISHPCGLNLWVVADNIRKGAATNAVQIAEILVKDYL